MLHPDQFNVNEAWLVFKVNRAPLHTEVDGDFNCIVLMDCASCFILSNESARIDDSEPSKAAVRRLFDVAEAHKHELPRTLFVPTGQFAERIPKEAERRGIAVVRVPEDQLVVYIEDARDAFAEYFADRDR